MKPTHAEQIRKDESRKRRRTAERWRRYIEDLRRKMQDERDSRRIRRMWLTLWLWTLNSMAAQIHVFSHAFSFALDPAPPPAPALPRKSEEKIPDLELCDDYDRHYLFDHRPRRGEEHLEVYDGLTYQDIVAANRIHRPHLSPKFIPVSGMPSRYAEEPVDVWELLDHIDSDYHREQALIALKLIVDPEARDWIDACAAEVGGLTYKDLRRKCRQRTPSWTLYEFPRAAARWREEQRREAEERKQEVKEIPNNGPKPPGVD